MWFLGDMAPLIAGRKGELAASPLGICIIRSRKEACRYVTQPVKARFCDVLHTNYIFFWKQKCTLALRQHNKEG